MVPIYFSADVLMVLASKKPALCRNAAHHSRKTLVCQQAAKRCKAFCGSRYDSGTVYYLAREDEYLRFMPPAPTSKSTPLVIRWCTATPPGVRARVRV